MLIDQILALPAGSVRVADIGAAFYGEALPPAHVAAKTHRMNVSVPGLDWHRVPQHAMLRRAFYPVCNGPNIARQSGDFLARRAEVA
jgi:hypothetical protein